jgi:hypothetical protein
MVSTTCGVQIDGIRYRGIRDLFSTRNSCKLRYWIHAGNWSAEVQRRRGYDVEKPCSFLYHSLPSEGEWVLCWHKLTSAFSYIGHRNEVVYDLAASLPFEACLRSSRVSDSLSLSSYVPVKHARHSPIKQIIVPRSCAESHDLFTKPFLLKHVTPSLQSCTVPEAVA